jgi:hypothetical protein
MTSVDDLVLGRIRISLLGRDAGRRLQRRREVCLVDFNLLLAANAIIVAIKMRRITWIATANGRRACGTGSRAIGIIDRAAKGALRPFGGQCAVAGRTMAMAAAILAVVMAAISS